MKVEKTTEKAAEKRRFTRKQKIIAIVAAVVLVLGAGTAYFLTSDLAPQVITAVRVGDHSLSAAQYSYYFSTAYRDFITEYASSLDSFGLDVSKRLDEQYIGGSTTTFSDYFAGIAQTNIMTVYCSLDHAREAGVTLSDEELSSIDAYIDSIEDLAEQQGIRLKSYLNAMYGKGVTLDIIREEVKRARLVKDYQEQLKAQTEVTEEMLLSAYEKNPDAFDTVDYCAVFVPVDETAADLKAAAEQAAETAQALVGAAVSESGFAEKAKELLAEPGEIVFKNEYKENVSVGEAAEWLFGELKKGEAKSYDALGGYWVVYLIDRVRPETKTVTVRHILSKPDGEVDEQTGMTAEQLIQAKKRAADALDAYEAGEKTEASFAALAPIHSADTATAAAGGLLQNVFDGQTPGAFSEWCFDPARKPGDVGTVEMPYGVHVIYFVGDGEPFWRAQLTLELQAQALNEKMEEEYKGVTYSVDDFGMNWFNYV